MDKRLLLLGGLGLTLWLVNRPNPGSAGAPGGAIAGTDGGACAWIAPSGDLVAGTIVGGGRYCRVRILGLAPDAIPGPGGAQDIPMQPGRANGPRPV